MPFIHVEWLPGRSLEQRRELVEVLTREISRIGGCEPESVDIVITDVEKDRWAHAGRLLSES